MKIKKSFLLAFFMWIIVNAKGQNINSTYLAQAKQVLIAKGIQEEDFRKSLSSKGLNIENMTEQDAVANKGLIQQTLDELASKNQPSSNLNQNSPEQTKLDTLLSTSKNRIEIVKEAEMPPKKIIDSNELKNSSIYGHQIFNNQSIDVFRISKDASPPDSYILSAGDKINIIIFGKSQADLQYEINVNGFIQPAQMPKIFLSGLTLKQAKYLLANRFSKYYIFGIDQFALILNTSRTININIFGEVFKPASYTTSALNTAVNILSVSGGPNDLGSVRNIQIIRGTNRKFLDIYAFMKDPSLQFDYFLQNNDIIYVPTAEILVSIEGAINRPMFYEMKKDEGLQDLISYAGGFKKDIYSDIVQIQRFENNIVVLKDYNLNELLNNKSFKFLNGDLVRIKSINSPLKKIIKISGAVSYPGTYDINTTKTVKGLIEKSKLIPEAKIDQAFIFRKNIDLSFSILPVPLNDIILNNASDIILSNEDSLVVFDQASFVDKFNISVVGDVRNPFEKKFKFNDGISINDAISLAGGLKSSSSKEAYINRNDPFNFKKTQYIPIDLNSAGQSELLKAGDQLVILNKEQFELESSISLGGEVNKQISLRYDPSLHLKDLFMLAGGITLEADKTRVDIFRLNFSLNEAPKKSIIQLKIDSNYNILNGPSNFDLSPFDFIVVRKIPNFKLQESIQIVGEVQYSGNYILDKEQYHFSDLIKNAGGLTNSADIYNVKLIRYYDKSGLLIFDAKKAMSNQGSIKFDPILFENDLIEIPKLKSTVNIETNATNYLTNSNQNKIQVVYQGQKSANWYIKNFAGGFDNKADLSSIKVIRSNGLITGTKKVLGVIRKYPKIRYGDTIKLNYKIAKIEKKKEDKPVDWDKFLAKIISVGTLYVLIINATR